MNSESRLKMNTGRTMPVMGLGTWKLTDKTADVVSEALNLGYRLIDTSGDYGTQPGIAEAIKRSGIARAKLFVQTKVEENEDAYEAVKRNLDELKLDYADLIMIHRPPDQGVGEELWKGLIKARDEGLTKDIGVSSYSTEQIQALKDATGVMPAVNQIEWSPFGHSKQMFDWCRQQKVIIQAYSLLTRSERLNDDAIEEIGKKYDKSPAQVLIRWNLQHGIVPLPKANQIEHLKQNIAVFDFELSEEDDAKLDALNEHYSATGELPYTGGELAFRERLES